MMHGQKKTRCVLYKQFIIKIYQSSRIMCAGHDVRAKGLSPSWADIERSIS